MSEHRFQTGGLLRIGVLGLHALALLAAVAVPGYAIFDAIRGLLDPAGSESLAALVDVKRWLALLGNTAVVCGVAVLTAGVIGGLLGLTVTRTDVPGKRVLFGAALFGACIPVYVSTIVFFSLRPAYDLMGSAAACGLLYGLVYTPLAALVLGVALRASDRELEELTLLDGGAWTVLRRVTIPQARWGAAVTGMIVVLLVAKDTTIADVLAVRTFAEETYTQYALDHRRAGPLLTAAPAFIVLAGVLVVVQARYRLFGGQSPWQFGVRPRVFALGRWRGLAGLACGLLVVAGVGGPMVLLLRHIEALAGLRAAVVGLQRELWTSAVLATVGATLVVLPAAGLAWSVARGGWLRRPIGAAVVLLLAVPSPVVGISLIAVLNNSVSGWILDSPFAMVIGYFVCFLPIAVLLLIPGVQRVPREVELAARVDGCDWLGVHWYIRCPALLADAAIVWLVVVILCFAEVSATVLLHPPAWPPASVRFATLIHYGVYQDLAVLALLSVAFILLPWALVLWLIRRALAAAGRTTWSSRPRRTI